MGYQDVEEQDLTQLEWRGRPPSYLRGTLFRNGPGRYDRGKVVVNHWFDGLALLHSFHLTPEEVGYRSRFVRSYDYRMAEMSGELGYPSFGTDPCRSLFRKVVSAIFMEATDNPVINVVKQGDRFLALTEIPIPMVFDPDSLHSRYQHLYKDPLPQGSTTAHPHFEGEHLFNHILHFSGHSSYRLYRQRNLEPREEFARVPVPEASYVHSFGLSQSYFVLTCSPLQVTPWKLLVRDRPFIENFEWKPDTGTRFHLVPKPGVPGEQIQLTTEPFFSFHHLNSFEEDGLLNVDLIAYPDASIIERLRLEHLRNDEPIEFGRPRRYRIDPARKTITREWESNHILELPRIDYARKNSRPYRYAYGVSAAPEESSFFDRIIKLDVTSDSALYWQEDDTYPSEPIFIADPARDKEDAGVLLSVVLSPDDGCSFLVVLDARTLQEVARAWIPQVVPHGFHGLYEPEH